MRIAYDVTPLSHPRTGVGNYILGTLKGMVAAGGTEHDFVAFGPVSVRGRKLVDESLEGLRVDRRLVMVIPAHPARRMWGALGRPIAERFLGRFDVMHFSDWMLPPQRSGLRATMIHDLGPLRFPEHLQRRTVSMHAATAREAARCDLVFTNSEFTAADVEERLGIDRDRIRVAYPGVEDRFSPDGERRSLGAPYVLTTATDDWRKNVGTLERAVELLGDFILVGPGRAGLGFSLARGASGPLPRRGGLRLSVALRGVRHPGRRGGWRPGVPCVVSSHPVARRGCRRCGGARRIPDSPEAVRRRHQRALGRARRARWQRVSHTRAASTGSRQDAFIFRATLRRCDQRRGRRVAARARRAQGLPVTFNGLLRELRRARRPGRSVDALVRTAIAFDDCTRRVW
jgi:hypothetical protein